MPRLVRRQPLSERLANFFNPWDFLLWISEEIESSDWAQLEKDWAQPLGFGLNFVFLIARANVATGTSRADYDIFGDDRSRLSVLSWAVSYDHSIQSRHRAFTNSYSGYRLLSLSIPLPCSL
jgi:hypothetical protein